jgi:hypothetical protein
VYLTPQTEGYTLSLRLIDDTARFFKNNRPDSVYTYKVVRMTEVTGTNYPEDQLPVLVLYNLYNGIRWSFVPLKVCNDYLVLQGQYVSSIAGELTYKRE